MCYRCILRISRVYRCARGHYEGISDNDTKAAVNGVTETIYKGTTTTKTSIPSKALTFMPMKGLGLRGLPYAWVLAVKLLSLS